MDAVDYNYRYKSVDSNADDETTIFQSRLLTCDDEHEHDVFPQTVIQKFGPWSNIAEPLMTCIADLTNRPPSEMLHMTSESW